MSFGSNVDLFLQIFRITKVFKIEQGETVKIYTPYQQNHDLRESGVCFWGPKSMKNTF